MPFAEETFHLAPGSFPFESRFVTAAGARVHYIDEGTGPVLFMVHGNPTWSFLYRKLILALRERYRCVALDLPGFGLSGIPPGFRYLPEAHAAVAAAFLEELNVREATLVAHDWGGPIGLAAGFAQPGRITRWVLGNTWAWPVNGDFHYEWFSALMGGPVGVFGARYNFFVNAFMSGSLRRGPLSKEVMHAYRAPLQDASRRTGTYVFPRAITGSRAFLGGLAARLKEIEGSRVLFVWPDRDVAFRATELDRWRTIFPQATVAVVKNCGHYVWEEAGDEAAGIAGAWLDAR